MAVATGQAVDVVAVLNGETSAQVFARARPMQARVFERSALMEHPLEDGTVIADHKVADPTEIDMPLFVTDTAELPEIFEEIRQLYDAGALLLVQTRAASYDNMVITEIPHEESGDTLGSLTIGLRLRQARFVQPRFGGLAAKQVEPSPKMKPKASTVKRGNQQTTKATPPQEAKAGTQAKQTTLLKIFGKKK